MSRHSDDDTVVEFLVRAAREFRRGGWVFTGFHWPVLAGQLAYHLDGEPFAQVFEAGGVTASPARVLPSSTTDYAAYYDALAWAGDTACTLLALPPRYTRVVLDAGNIDMRGRVNSSMVGDARRPRVRLPGGGGAPDVSARARELVWLFGGPDLRRLQREVEHVTAAPAPSARVLLHTRWGLIELGDSPRLVERADVPGADDFVAHLVSLDVDVHDPRPRPACTPQERHHAVELLRQAAHQGYQVALRAVSAPQDASGRNTDDDN